MSAHIRKLATESASNLVTLPKAEWFLLLKSTNPNEEPIIEQMRTDLMKGVVKAGNAAEVYVERAQVLAMCDLVNPPAPEVHQE